ncbi:phage tail protein [Paenibacillus whitsoniae]|uniref:Phage tail protein n=1 Tax=Paenibacillus whitsoniae TaxID=2496558 RepID=A0A3S0IA99_9BACL|nr:tail fiber protein [Paenibacillus whitsoniae]RTE08539.1 phage tail protein [Paenibacillus whitsoniae]
MSDQYVGEIRMFSGTFAPIGWLLCNGQIVNITQYEALYTLIGTTYGGDGRSTFALPDLRGRVPIHMGAGYVLGQMAGVEKVTLTTDQMAAHKHIPSASSVSGTSSSPANAFWATNANTAVKPYSTTAPNTTMNPAAISSVGGNQPHDNMMPFLTVSFIIATEGVFPSQY